MLPIYQQWLSVSLSDSVCQHITIEQAVSDGTDVGVATVLCTQ